MQAVVLIVTLVLMAALAAFYVQVIRTTGEPAAGGGWPGDGVRGLVTGALVVIGAVLAGVTLVPWPHAVPAGQGTVTVRATASQWSWEIEPRRVPVGTAVVFEVTASDVNHGFSVYDPSGRLLFQTQAMPGWTNRVAWRFTTPGSYTIRCLEYCGLAHHAMDDGLEVVAGG